MTNWSNKSGFTLIEVLVALAILSIALTAIIKAASQNIQHTAYLQQKMIAAWVGTEAMNEIRAHVLVLTSEAEEERTALGQTWSLKESKVSTPNPKIQEIHIEVSSTPNNIPLQRLIGYLYEE